MQIQPDDTVSVRDGEYEATVLGVDENKESAKLFGEVGPIGTPSGAVVEPLEDLTVVDDD